MAIGLVFSSLQTTWLQRITDHDEQDSDQQTEKGAPSEPLEIEQAEQCALLSEYQGHSDMPEKDSNESFEVMKREEASKASLESQLLRKDRDNTFANEVGEDNEEEEEREAESFDPALYPDVPIINSGPQQPDLTSYPVKIISGRTRSFQKDWYG